MRVRAFAKINRSLRVLGTRPDGYHELRTIFQSIALHDTLTIRAIRGPFRLTCDDPGCPVDDTNLIARAAAAMWKASGRRGAPRRRRYRSEEAHPDAGRSRRRQQRRRRGVARARATVARLRREGRGSGRGARRRRAVLSRRRRDARPRARRSPLSSRRAHALVGRARPAGLRSQHPGRVRVVRRTSEREALSRAAVARLKGSRSTCWSTISRRRSLRVTPRSAVSFRHSGDPGPPRRRCRGPARPYSACFPRVPPRSGPKNG